MRVVVDTNVLVSAILFGGVPGRLLKHAATERVTVVTSAWILDEFERTLLVKFGWPAATAAAARATIGEISETAYPRVITVISRDPDDDNVIATAMEGAATVIVSGDNDLLELGAFAGIEIVRPRELLHRLEPG